MPLIHNNHKGCLNGSNNKCYKLSSSFISLLYAPPDPTSLVFSYSLSLVVQMTHTEQFSHWTIQHILRPCPTGTGAVKRLSQTFQKFHPLKSMGSGFCGPTPLESNVNGIRSNLQLKLYHNNCSFKLGDTHLFGSSIILLRNVKSIFYIPVNYILANFKIIKNLYKIFHHLNRTFKCMCFYALG